MNDLLAMMERVFEQRKLCKFKNLLYVIDDDKEFFKNGYIELIVNNKKITKVNFKSHDSVNE